eukprot:CAMPEP_0172745892 /NCGR_PEP_ID=MMETSP1074-20121228/139096_1 /TAXON_ID=2916 /ORGANISM="Ceratium fusus, Strain PA161109" /LENGTH=106 /DNA_ID=CAMNT_0013577153 /DNA_START=300 /DNA_END=621 /DNA_ORIENTATION=-
MGEWTPKLVLAASRLATCPWQSQPQQLREPNCVPLDVRSASFPLCASATEVPVAGDELTAAGYGKHQPAQSHRTGNFQQLATWAFPPSAQAGRFCRDPPSRSPVLT